MTPDATPTRLADVRPGDIIGGERVTCVLRCDGRVIVTRGRHAELRGHDADLAPVEVA